MTDSSEDEDLSRFKEVVDTSFTNLLHEKVNKSILVITEEQKPKSERYLEVSSHYNDVKVPEKMQNQIGAKISSIISKRIEFVEVEQPKIKKSKLKGGVKLFKTSDGFLSCEEVKDVYTDLHNMKSRTIKPMKRRIDEEQDLTENDKIHATVVTGEDILLKDDTKLWKSRRKEKLFKYKTQGKSKVLLAVD